jgi:hypothetical protein
MKLAVALAGALAFGNAYAFHDGGVATCDGCHTMHNSQLNTVMVGSGSPQGGAPRVAHTVAGTNTQFQGKNFLLQGSDDSSTCLNCHSGATLSSYHVLTYPAPAAGTGPVNRTPGGDFAWLTISEPVVGHASVVAGERHGHNIVAADFGLVPDTTLLTAPGGTYAASALSCASCHDPHARARYVDGSGVPVYPKLGSATAPIVGSGSYTNSGTPTATAALGTYRFLGGSNYSQMSYSNATPFTADPPIAVAPATYNRSESATDTRVAYGKGMSEWCSNCHVAIHNGNVNAANTALIHPAGNSALLSATANDLQGNAAGTTIGAIYNAYKMSGDLSGVQTASYTSLVPYEMGTTSLATLQAVTGTAGPVSTAGGTENVMCLSCHRAHASGFSSMTRWDNTQEYIVAGGAWMPGTTYPQYGAAMYDRNPTVYASYQRSLCNKCHAKD